MKKTTPKLGLVNFYPPSALSMQILKEDDLPRIAKEISERLTRPRRNLLVKKAAWIFAFILLNCPPASGREGTASFYGAGERLNERTANNDVFYPTHLTAASYAFPLNSYVRCRSLGTGKEITVFLNDRGPAKRLGRMIDLSHAAFRLIDDPAKGLIEVRCEEVRL